MITGVPKGYNNLQQQQPPKYVFSKISAQGSSSTTTVFVRNPNCPPDSAIRRPTVRSLVLSEIFFPLEDGTAPGSVLRAKSACPPVPDRRSCVVFTSRDNPKTTTAACEKDLIRNPHLRPSPPMRSQRCYSQILTAAPKSSKATASQRSKPPPHPLIYQSSFGAETTRERTPDSDSIFHRLQSFLGLGKNPKVKKEKLPPAAVTSFSTVVPSPPNSFPEISRPSVLPQIRSRSQSVFRSQRSQKPLSDIFHSRKSHQVATAADAATSRQQARRSERKTTKLPPSVSLSDAPRLQPCPPPPSTRAVTGDDLLTPSASTVLVPLIYTSFSSHQPTTITADCRPVYADSLQISSFVPSNVPRPAYRSRQHVGHQFRRRAGLMDYGGGAGEVPAAVACCISDVSRCKEELHQKHYSAHFAPEVRKAPSQTSSAPPSDVNRSRSMGSASQSMTGWLPPLSRVLAHATCRAAPTPLRFPGPYAYAMPVSADHGPRGLVGAGNFLSSDSQSVHESARSLGVRPYLRRPGFGSASSSTSLGQPVGQTRRPTSAGQTPASRDSPGLSATPSPFEALETCRSARVPVGFVDAQSQTSSDDSAVELHHRTQRSQSVATQSECEGSCENGSCYSSPPRLEELSTVASPQSPPPSAPTTAAVTPTAGVPRPIEVDTTPTQESTAVSTTNPPSVASEEFKIAAARSGSTATLTGRGRHSVPSPCEADPRLPLESPLCIPNERSEVEGTAGVASSEQPEEIKLPPALEAKSYHYNPMDLVQRRRRPQPHYQRQRSTNRDSLIFRNSQCHQQSPVFNEPNAASATFLYRNSPNSEDQAAAGGGHKSSPFNADAAAADGNWWADILPYKPSTIPDTLADRLRHCSSLALSRVDLSAADTRSLASSVSRTDLSRRSLMTRSLFEPRAVSPGGGGGGGGGGAQKDSDDDGDGDPPAAVAGAEELLRSQQPIASQLLLLRPRSSRQRPVSYHDSCRAFTPAPMAQLPSLEHLSRSRRRLPKAPAPAPPPPAPTTTTTTTTTEPCNIQEFLQFTAGAVPPAPCESPLLTPYCRLRVLRGSACPSATEASTSALRP